MNSGKKPIQKKTITKAMNQTMYDECATRLHINDSVTPMGYQLFKEKYINSNRCGGNDGVEFKSRVDTESELFNITRPLSQCVEMKYLPNCDSKICKGTFKMRNVTPFDICPIVENNMPVIKNPGFVITNTF